MNYRTLALIPHVRNKALPILLLYHLLEIESIVMNVKDKIMGKKKINPDIRTQDSRENPRLEKPQAEMENSIYQK